jgi:uncharacterized tellurite resistance protein B-like protein
MTSNKNYHLGLLFLVHLLINVDGELDESERAALAVVIAKEKVPADLVAEFEREVTSTSEREIYQRGIQLLNSCSDEEKLMAFVHLYKLSEADGRVHVKEVRLLLYSIKMAGVEFNDVIARAKAVS